MLKRTIAAACLLTLVVAACNDDKKPTNSNGSGAISSNGSAEMAYAVYRFHDSGCPMDEYTISGTSDDEITKKFCDALQNDPNNHHCNIDIRKTMFERACVGYAWNPRSANRDGDAPRFTVQPRNRDALSFSVVSHQLEDLQIEEYKLAESFSGPEALSLGQFMDDMSSCGLNTFGPKCFGYFPISSSHLANIQDGDKSYFVAIQLRIREISIPLLYVFHVSSDGNKLTADSVKIYKVLRDLETRSLREYLGDADSVQEIATATLQKDVLAAAHTKLKAARNIRELFHQAELILNSSNENTSPGKKQEVATAIVAQQEIIAASKDSRYQSALLHLLSRTGATSTQMIIVCDAMLKSKDPSILEEAAIALLEHAPNRLDIRPLVVKALGNSAWNIRRDAVEVLAKRKPSLEEQVQIMNRLGDSDSDVQKAASAASNQFKLDAEHVPALILLSQSSQWSVRNQAVQLLGKISDPRVAEHLIGQMKDGDSDVAASTLKILKSRTLGVENIPSLSKNLENSSWNIRNESLLLLSQIPGDEVTKILISKIPDSDSDVAKNALAKVKARTLLESDIADLQGLFASQSWTVRQKAAMLLGLIKSPAALEALLDQLNVEKDSDVLAELKKSIQILRKK